MKGECNGSSTINELISLKFKKFKIVNKILGISGRIDPVINSFQFFILKIIEINNPNTM